MGVGTSMKATAVKSLWNESGWIGSHVLINLLIRLSAAIVVKQLTYDLKKLPLVRLVQLHDEGNKINL
jgi:hypothetical protein